MKHKWRRRVASRVGHPLLAIEKVENPLIAEHATAYAQATDGLKAARAELKVDIGDRPAQLREREAATAAWLGDDKTPLSITLSGNDSGATS